MAKIIIGLAVVIACLIWTDASVQRLLHSRAAGAVATIETELNRAAFFPQVLARDPRLADAIARPSDTLADELNKTFGLWSKSSGADHIFLMDDAGTTISASNWDQDDSFVGRNYGFRPYFKQAINNGTATFFAVGVTTGKAGYFIASAVSDGAGRHIGVVVVKFPMTDLVDQISGKATPWLIIDDLHISILSSNDALNYRVWQPREGQAQAAHAQRRYSVKGPRLAPFELGGGRRVIAGTDGIGIGGVFVQKTILTEPWTFVSIAAFADVTLMLLWRLSLLSLLWVTLWLAWRLHRNQRIRAQLLALQASDIRAELVQTQEQLVRKQSWAAIGEMSAAIAHEVNQPLASLRFDLASIGKIGLNGQEASRDDAFHALEEAKNTTTRIARIIETLRLFARQNELAVADIGAFEIIASSFEGFTKDRPKASQLVHWDHDGIDQHVCVCANAVLLEQVIINLLSNAVAAADRDTPQVIVRGPMRHHHVVEIVVADNGAQQSGRLCASGQLPVGSTKSLREGFGLGLTLSHRFIERIGGNIEMRTRDQWTEFVISLEAQ